MFEAGKNHILGPRDIVRSGLCIGCGNCAAQTENSAAKMEFDRYGQLEPTFSNEREQQCFEVRGNLPVFADGKNEDELAAELFPEAFQKHSSSGRFLKAYVGYVETENFREKGSSGGMVSRVLAELMRKNLIDGAAHVVAADDPQKEGRFFNCRILRTEDGIRSGAKSRYYPVEMSEILKEIEQIPGRYAVTGVPYFIKAAQLLRRENPLFRERVAFTLGLFAVILRVRDSSKVSRGR